MHLHKNIIYNKYEMLSSGQLYFIIVTKYCNLYVIYFHVSLTFSLSL